MRYSLLSILIFCISLQSFGNPVLNKLCTINRCWTEQKDIWNIPVPANFSGGDKEWIQLHLSLVERTLRSRHMAGFSPAQKQNRLACLDYLHQYWQAGRFPQNEDYTYRTPIFIDKHDNFCAVGYLVKASGHEDVSRMIAARTNIAYVCEMRYPQLLAWAKEYGFTVDELAWIQPTYYPNAHLDVIGRGTDGSVKELFADNADQKLYVGGSFKNVDSTLTCNNIAYVTESNGIYTWHNLGSGTNGPVYAIATYNNKVFAGGSFTTAGGVTVNNIAYWDGSTWQNAGCINGIVKDLVVFNGNLYAAGQFSTCSPSSPVNFAQWIGSGWLGINGLSGTVNAMEVRDTSLFLGGAFSYNSNTVNAIKWNPNPGFQPFFNTIANEVNDFEVYKDTMYATCKYSGDPDVLQKLSGSTWGAAGAVPMYSNGTLTANAACVLADTFIIAGDFYKPYAMYAMSNSMNVGGSIFTKNYYFMADRPVNKMAVFKNHIFVGGDFHMAPGDNNGIGCMNYGLQIDPVFATTTSTQSCGAPGTASVSAIFGIPPYKYLWSTGDTTATIQVPPGTYTVTVKDVSFYQTTGTVVVEMAIDTTLARTGDVLSVKTTGASYQWINCDNNTILPNDTLASLAVNKTGSYAAIIKIGSCVDTTGCYTVVPSYVKELAHHTTVQVYPNPASDVLNITFDKNISQVDIAITNLFGCKIAVAGKRTGDRVMIDINSLASGLYTLKIACDGNVAQYKFLKN